MKKDTNYVASVEKSVAEKYGKIAVQDFRSEWREEKEKVYLDQLREARENKVNEITSTKEIGDNTVIKLSSRKNPENRVCPVCKTYSFSPIDDLYMNRFECCHPCYVDFVEFRQERWDTGWRPTTEDKKIYLTGRKTNG